MSELKKILNDFATSHDEFLNQQNINSGDDYLELLYDDFSFKEKNSAEFESMIADAEKKEATNANKSEENNALDPEKQYLKKIQELKNQENPFEKIHIINQVKDPVVKARLLNEQTDSQVLKNILGPHYEELLSKKQKSHLIKKTSPLPTRTESFSSYGKIPPQNVHYEEKLLSLLLNEPDLLKKLPDQDIKKTGFFYKDHHQKIFSAINKRKGNTTLATIATELKNKGILEDVGGRRHLKELFEIATDKEKKLFEIFYQDVQKTYHQRNMIRMATDISNVMFNETPLIDKVELITGEKRFRPARKIKADEKEQTFVDMYRKVGEAFIESIPYPYKIDYSLDALANQAFGEIDATIARGGKPEISTCIKHLDRFTHGIRRGRTGVVAGGSKVGKTTFMASLTDAVMSQNGAVSYYTYETKPWELIQKLIAKRSQVNLAKFEYYTEEDPFTEEEQERVYATKDEIKNLPLHLEGGEPDVEYIISNSKYQKILNPNLRLVVIDGIQAFSDQKPDKETKAEFYYNTINKFNKEIAEYLGVQVIITGQLRRIGLKDKKPRHVDDIADCKGLGDIIDWAFALYQANEQAVLQGIPLAVRQDEKPKRSFELHSQRNLGYIGEIPLPRKYK
ncbi:MAG: DnaB-like helicase C-terminal domain-containing protein [Candidatus Woesearchaeota archaeon]